MLISLKEFIRTDDIAMDLNKSFKADSEMFGDINFSGDCTLIGRIYRLGEGFSLDARLVYSYMEKCSRCMKEFENTIETGIKVEIVESLSEDTLDDEIAEVLIDKEKNIDMTEAIKQAIYLSLPMKPLCKEDCNGLCPKCGKDLNIGDCDCDREDCDPRFEKLKSLLK